ncbi:MAG: deacetylase, partial [Burkholderiales bacterium]
MSETPFIITIDTEGDDLWARPREITTRNAEYLPRFQSLCERFGFKPVYLTNYEMAMSDVFVAFGRDVAARGAGEIGMHLHAW